MKNLTQIQMDQLNILHIISSHRHLALHRDRHIKNMKKLGKLQAKQKQN